MKKLLIMAAAAGMVFASCTNDNEEAYVSNNNQKITFTSPVMYGLTRANVTGQEMGVSPDGSTTALYDKKENFQVFGITYPTDNFSKWSTGTTVYGTDGETAYYNQIVKGWDTQKPHFWKESVDYAFAAYSPADIVGMGKGATAVTYTDGGLGVDNFTPNDVLAKQYDLMYSRPVMGVTANDKTGQDGLTGYNGVTLKFYHALTSVHFKVCAHPEYIKSLDGVDGVFATGKAFYENDVNASSRFTLKSISIKNVKAAGDFQEGIVNYGTKGGEVYLSNATKTENSTISADNKKSNYDADATGYDCWTPTGSTGDYTFYAGTEVLIPAATSDGEVKTVATDIKGAYNGNTIDGDFAMLIPQAIPANAYIEIVWNDGENDRTDKIFLNDATMNPVTTAWKMGYRYTYVLGFSKNRIYFAPEVETWTDEGPSTPNDPIVM